MSKVSSNVGACNVCMSYKGNGVTYGRIYAGISRTYATWWSAPRDFLHPTWPVSEGTCLPVCWPLNNVDYVDETSLIGQISFYFIYGHLAPILDGHCFMEHISSTYWYISATLTHRLSKARPCFWFTVK